MQFLATTSWILNASVAPIHFVLKFLTTAKNSLNLWSSSDPWEKKDNHKKREQERPDNFLLLKNILKREKMSCKKREETTKWFSIDSWSLDSWVFHSWSNDIRRREWDPKIITMHVHHSMILFLLSCHGIKESWKQRFPMLKFTGYEFRLSSSFLHASVFLNFWFLSPMRNNQNIGIHHLQFLSGIFALFG